MADKTIDFIIIGAQKSASTFLQTCLADHPEIHLAKGEVSYFETPDYEQGSIKELSKLVLGVEDKCVGIKRPNYLGRGEVAPRITQHLPNAKLIAVLRNPVERAISAYFHYIRFGFVPPMNGESGFDHLLSNEQYRQQYKRSAEILEFGRYYKYLTTYQHYISRGQILIYLHEDIRRDPLGSVQKAYKFLGVQSDHVPTTLGSRPQKGVYNLTRLKLLSLRNKFLYDYNDDNTRLHSKHRNLTDYLCATAISVFDRLLLKPFLTNKPPTISTRLQDSLYEEYREDLIKLEKLIGRSLATWRTGGEVSENKIDS